MLVWAGPILKPYSVIWPNMFNKVIIIGAGLIGGSIGQGLKQYNLAKHIIFIDINRLQDADIQKQGFGLGEYTDIPGADLVILAIPILSMAQVLQAIRPLLSAAMIVMDVASTKQHVLSNAEQILGDLFSRFIPTHPIAGKETSGFLASTATLLQDHPVILTPVAATDRAALATISKLWQTLGANTVEMDPATHDQCFAKYSHLANILSFLLMSQARASPHLPPELLPPSFIEMTRLAKSSPVMWHDICLSNRRAILQALEHFEQDLQTLKASLERQDDASLSSFFTSTSSLSASS